MLTSVWQLNSHSKLKSGSVSTKNFTCHQKFFVSSNNRYFRALTDKCELFDAFFESTLTNENRLGENGQLKIAPDSFLLNPCPTPPNYCAGSFCHADLGEVCIKGKCAINYCSDVQYCPTNTTCNNLADRAVCSCNPGNHF